MTAGFLIRALEPELSECQKQKKKKTNKTNNNINNNGNDYHDDEDEDGKEDWKEKHRAKQKSFGDQDEDRNALSDFARSASLSPPSILFVENLYRDVYSIRSLA
jgi:hypothetical protein